MIRSLSCIAAAATMIAAGTGVTHLVENHTAHTSTTASAKATAQAASAKAASPAKASSPAKAAVLTKEKQAAMSPDDVIAALKEGNKRFVSGKTKDHDFHAQAIATASGQYPMAIVLSCIDSRVPVEIVFDQGIGDIFVGRVAGNFEDTGMLGSFEFGTKFAGSKVIVVLGHSSCGAVKGAIAGVTLGNLTETLDNIHPAIAEFERARQRAPRADNKNDVAAVVEANVRQTLRDMTRRSPVMAGLVESGDLKVVGAVYDIKTGTVNWLD